ncbi:hypothetical protein K9M74_05210 [Candidatus Woesearchaeota archaeon]|nr:hypothetical protein [Candidatus Woesearchaeota archaeon]
MVFHSKKGIELSINMLVVIILGIIILVAGLTMFYKAYDNVGGLNDQVDAQTQARLNALLDDGAPIVVLMNTKTGERGDGTIFSVAVNNNLPSTKHFKINVSYATTTADYSDECSGNNPFLAENCYCEDDFDFCADNWILGGKREFTLENNERKSFPVQITLPKKNIKRGQYIFNLDVYYKELTDSDYVPFSTRQKLYVTIN